MKAIALLLAILISAAAAPPSEIDALVDRAQGLPGEFAADGLIRLAALDKIPAKRRIQMLEQAFARAAESVAPFRRRPAVRAPGFPLRFADHAYGQELDALSLRMRAVEAMLPLDRRKARELFLETGFPRVPQLSCEDYLAYDPSRFYEVLGRVAAETFNGEEIRKGEPLRLLARFTGVVSSAAEVAPAARAIAGAEVGNEDFQALVVGFAGALARISGDDRAFTASVRDAAQRIQALAGECRRRRLSDIPLLEAYRSYLTGNLSGKRCADSERAAADSTALVQALGNPAENAQADPVALFNDMVRGSSIQPIGADETVPSSVEGKAKVADLCRDSGCQTVSARYRAIIFDPTGKPFTEGYRASNEFQVGLRELLAAMAAWKESPGGTAADHYRQKVELYSDVFNLVSGPSRDLVTNAMLEFVDQNRFQTENAIEWFLPVSTLIWRAGSDATLAARLRGARDPIVAFYARLELVAPRDPGRVLPLL